MALIAGRFGRAEPRRTAREFVLGLLSPAERKNCWWLAEQAGHGDPQAMQRLLRTAVWDADAVRDDLRAFVAGQLGDAAGVLIPDETGFLKKGTGSVGVQRQYSGTAGRIENSQVGVFLSYASPRGRALIDRRVYLPRSWADDPQRCAAAGVPADTQFAAKPELALDMITDAVAAKVPAAWVTADEVYGDNGAFRTKVAGLGLGYVLAVSCAHRILAFRGGKWRLRADHIAAALPTNCWHRISAGTGSKGPRWYDWAWASAHQVNQSRHTQPANRKGPCGADDLKIPGSTHYLRDRAFLHIYPSLPRAKNARICRGRRDVAWRPVGAGQAGMMSFDAAEAG